MILVYRLLTYLAKLYTFFLRVEPNAQIVYIRVYAGKRGLLTNFCIA